MKLSDYVEQLPNERFKSPNDFGESPSRGPLNAPIVLPGNDKPLNSYDCLCKIWELQRKWARFQELEGDQWFFWTGGPIDVPAAVYTPTNIVTVLDFIVPEGTVGLLSDIAIETVPEGAFAAISWKLLKSNGQEAKFTPNPVFKATVNDWIRFRMEAPAQSHIRIQAVNNGVNLVQCAARIRGLLRALNR